MDDGDSKAALLDEKVLLTPAEIEERNKKTAVSPLVCSFFLLNMLLGSGPLTLPYAFSQAGLGLGTVFVVVGAFIAYVSATFLIECLAGSNAILKKRRSTAVGEDVQFLPGSTASDAMFNIEEKIEVGEMAGMYFGPKSTKCVYAMLVLYLYGTLCVYALTVAKSLNQMASFEHAYYIYLTAFGAMVVPLSFGSFENTKPLQVVIAYIRCVSFFTIASTHTR
jgi:amino acid permease